MCWLYRCIKTRNDCTQLPWRFNEMLWRQEQTDPWWRKCWLGNWNTAACGLLVSQQQQQLCVCGRLPQPFANFGPHSYHCCCSFSSPLVLLFAVFFLLCFLSDPRRQQHQQMAADPPCKLLSKPLSLEQQQNAKLFSSFSKRKQSPRFIVKFTEIW